MATPHQLFHLRDLLRSLKYMFAFASFVALAGIVFLTTVHSRVTTAVLIGMCDPRLHFLYAGGVRVGRARRSRGVSGAGTLPDDIGMIYDQEAAECEKLANVVKNLLLFLLLILPKATFSPIL
ncbi:hypothetical protein KCU77_g147, partial [Aureobasidium melanogenum]